MSIHPETVKTGVDALSLTIIAGTFVEYLPQIAAGASLVWTILRILETKAARSLFSRIKSLFVRKT